MSNDEYQQQRLFCEQVKMRKPKIKVSATWIPGICFGIGLPLTDYQDLYICFLFWGISFKWRKR